MQQVGQMRSFEKLMATVNTRQAWERENDRAPLCTCHGHTLTAAWREALREDDERTKRAEWEALQARLALNLPRLLTEKLGVQAVHANAYGHLDEGRPSLRAARRYLRQVRPVAHPVLFLAGPTNKGKTQAAVDVLADWARHYPWNAQAGGRGEAPMARFAKAREVASLSSYSDEGRAALEDFRACPLLVLDDLGTEVATGPGASLLYDVVDARYGAGRRTVVTSNLLEKEMVRDYDERLLRRLRDTSIWLMETKAGGALYEGGKRVASYNHEGRQELRP